jgi:hypothetical protein
MMYLPKLFQLMKLFGLWFMMEMIFFFVKAIQRILLECSPNEYYLINKKYEWLLSVNHHDSLTGTGVGYYTATQIIRTTLTRNDYINLSGVIGKSRTRLPVA